MSYLRALKFNRCSVRHDFLRTQRQKFPPFTLSPEPIKREQERGKEVFREVYNTIPVMRKAVSALRMTLKVVRSQRDYTPGAGPDHFLTSSGYSSS